VKDRKAAHGLGKGSVSSKATGKRRFGREGLQVTECCVDVQSYTSVQSWREGSERDGTAGNISFICCGLIDNPVTLCSVRMQWKYEWKPCLSQVIACTRNFRCHFLEFSDDVYCTQKEGIIVLNWHYWLAKMRRC